MQTVFVVIFLISIVVFGSAIALLFLNGRRNPLLFRAASRAGGRFVIILIASFIVIGVSITLVALREIRQDLEDNIQASLSTVLETTRESILLWVTDQSTRHAQIISDPEFRDAALSLVQSYQQSPSRLTPDAELLERLRDRFRVRQNLNQNDGFSIIDLQGNNVAAMRDESLGTYNPIFRYSPASVERALDGVSVFVAAVPSDIELPGLKTIRGLDRPPTMFIVTPILNADNQVAALLSERFDPHANFSKILQLGRIGETGESYAFNSDGFMVSDSRFESQLVEMGMLTVDEQTVLSVPLIEPIVDNRQPVFTKMAQSALQQQSSFNVQGYPDYRGVPVVGAWLWDAQLNIGITTEMDLAEAFAPYYKARALIILILTVTLIVAVSYSWLTLALGHRANRFYEKASEQLETMVLERTQKLAESERMVQVLINTVPAPMFLKDAAGRYELVNDEFERVVGKTREEVYGKTDWDILPEDAARQVIENDHEIMESGQGVVLEEVVPNYKNESRVFQAYKVPVMGDENQATGLVGVSIDISQRIQTENQLKNAMDSLAFVQHAVDGAAYMVTWADTKTGEILYANTAAQEFLRLDDYNVESLYVWDLDRTAHAKDFETFVNDLRAGPRTYETKVVDGQGEEHPVDITSQIVVAGLEERLVSFARDISLHKRLENELISARTKAEEGSRAKSEFLASMSHEIRTPLNGVLGMIGLVRRDDLNPIQDEQLRVAQNSANSLLDIINDLLDFTKIEAQRLDIEELDFNLPDLLGDITKSLAYRAEEKNLELILDLSDLHRQNIKSDPTRLRQLIVNLLGNAIKFTETGEVILRAWVEEAEDALTLHCTVTDTGVGISEEVLPQLFNSFTQADASTTRRFGGTGLGLAICKKLVELMEGDISVRSQLNEGSEFKFSIRVFESTQVIDALPNRTLDTLRVLIVDDIETNRVIFKAQVESWGVQVEEASSGQQALEFLKHRPSDYFDIALLDMNMPNMDGYALAQNIRENDDWLDISLLLMTSTIDFIQSNELSRIGFDGYFSKPVTPSDLHDALLMISEHSKTLREQGLILSSRYLQTLKRVSDQEPESRLVVDPHLRILLVEDNEINQMIATGMLETYSLTCHVKQNGQEAIDFLKERSAENPIDLVLMDCQMPVLDGYAATENIRAGAAGEWAKTLPIVAMTAHALKGDREKCFTAGMNDFITKPIEQAEFHRVLARFSKIESPESDAVAEPTGYKETLTMVSSKDAIQWPSNLSMINPAEAPAFSQMRGPYLAALTIFKDQAHELQRNIKTSFSDLDFETLRGLAHSLKGSSGNLGFMTLSKAAADIENAIRENGQCHALQISQIADLIERGQLDATAIVNANDQDAQSQESSRALHEIVLEAISLLSENQVVSVDLIQELTKASEGTDQAASIAEVANQLNNFEYDDALRTLKSL